MSKAPQLVSQHLENISRDALEKYQQIVRRFVQRGGEDLKNRGLRLLEAIDDLNVVAPGNLCNELLHDSLIRPCLRKRPHILEVPGRKAGDLWKRPAEVLRQAVDHLRAPSFFLLCARGCLVRCSNKNRGRGRDDHR